MLNLSRITLLRVIIQTVKRDLYFCTFTAALMHTFLGSISIVFSPCIRLARGKFELTNQDSVGGKNSSVLM